MIQQKVHIPGTLPMSRERAVQLINLTSTFTCGIYLESDNFTVNAKSLLGILAISKLSKRDLTLVADGPDEAEAVEAILRFFAQEEVAEAE